MEDAKNIKVLIVDDEDRFRLTTTATLKKRGFSVRAAASGPEAIEEVKKRDVDVVVLDIKMPYMDGHETLRELRRLKPDLEVIVLTGHGSLGSAIADRRQDVFAFLSKPCNIDSLAQRICEAFAKKGGNGEYGRRAKDVMVPLSAFLGKIHAHQTMAEAVDVVLQFFPEAGGETGLHETLHRVVLVFDEDEQVMGAIGFADLLRGLQQPCIWLLEKESMMPHSVCLDASSCMDGFAMTVCEKAARKVRDLLPPKPPLIDGAAELTEALDKMLRLHVANLLVVEKDVPVGVLREKDLFLEMARIVKSHRPERAESAPWDEGRQERRSRKFDTIAQSRVR